MHYRTIDFVLWLTAPIMQLWVLIAMFRRHLHQRYPLFFGYTILQVIAVPILAAIMLASYELYYYAYYVDVGLSLLLSFAVVWEVARVVFALDEKPGHLQLFLKLCCAVSAIAVCGYLMRGGAPAHSNMLTQAMMTAERLLRAIQVLLVIVIVVFASRLAVRGSQFDFGLICGFGLFSITNITIAQAVSRHGHLTSVALSRLNGIAYLVACMIWLAYALYGKDSGGANKGVMRCQPFDRYQQFRNSTEHWYLRLETAFHR
jgi:hypothetical protein